MASTRTARAAFTTLTLLAAGLTSSCTGASTDASGEDPPPSTPAAHEDLSLTEVGPLLLGAPDLWSIPETTDGATIVKARVCEPDLPCPSFAVLQGEAIDSTFDPSVAYTKDGIPCPAGLTPEDIGATPLLTDVVIDGVGGTLAEFEVACVNEDGVETLAASQVQWHLPDAPGGPVLIVDRWSFDGLRSAVAGATWAAS